MTDEWVTVKTFELEGRFSITAPEGWENSHAEDVLLLLVNPSVEGSGIFIDYTAVDWSGLDLKERLGKANEDFLNGSIIPVSSQEGRVVKDITSVVVGGDEAITIRTFVTFENADVWVIQLALPVEKQLVFIVHWNGPGQIVKELISPIFDSFEIGG